MGSGDRSHKCLTSPTTAASSQQDPFQKTAGLWEPRMLPQTHLSSHLHQPFPHCYHPWGHTSHPKWQPHTNIPKEKGKKASLFLAVLWICQPEEGHLCLTTSFLHILRPIETDFLLFFRQSLPEHKFLLFLSGTKLYFSVWMIEGLFLLL